MRVLGLDTTGRLGGVALLSDGELVDACVGDPAMAYAQRLPGDILRLLERHGLRASDVDVFAVAAGPGSFTGLRIGIAAVQGLAYATARSVVGVPALEALAHAAGQLAGESGHPRVGVWMDAQREEVFAAAFERVDGPDLWQMLDGPLVDAPRVVAQRWRDREDIPILPVVGDGAVRYRSVLEEVLGGGVHVIEPPPMAPSVAALGWQRALRGEAGLPHAIRPLYVRRPDAELARDRAAAKTP